MLVKMTLVLCNVCDECQADKSDEGGEGERDEATMSVSLSCRGRSPNLPSYIPAV